MGVFLSILSGRLRFIEQLVYPHLVTLPRSSINFSTQEPQSSL